MNDAIAELLLRYELGDFTPRVRARLAQIFATNPVDALERLQRAAQYVGITGATEQTSRRIAAQLKAAELAQSVSTTTSRNAYTVKRKDVKA